MSSVSYVKFEYKFLASLQRIPAAYESKENNLGPEVNKALKSKLFDFYSNDFDTFSFTIKQAKRLIFKTIEDVLINLYSVKGLSASASYKDTVEKHSIPINSHFAMLKAEPLFCIMVSKGNERTLFVFKEFGCNYIPPLLMEGVRSLLHFKQYHYISMVEECAFAAVLNHSNNISDKSLGTNDYTFKDYFISEFGEDEYRAFRDFSIRITGIARSCLGFSIVRPLTPQALFSFKQIVNKELLHFDYCSNIRDILENIPDQSCIEKINTQFFRKKYYMAVLNESQWQDSLREDCLFSESFLTAEWLRQSLPSNEGTDLTVVALGYFKAIEEFLFSFIACFAGEKNKWIDTHDAHKGSIRNSSYKQDWQSYLTISILSNKKKYIMMERMINFIFDFDDLLIETSVKSALLTALKSIKPLRNDFFHKGNLHDIHIVDQIRKYTFIIFYLLLGSMRTTSTSHEILGIPTDEDHFQLLCSYVELHTNSSYYLDLGDGKLSVAIGQPDENVQYSQSGNAYFSGIHFNLLVGFPASERILTIKAASTSTKRKLCFTRQNVPNRIYKGSMIACSTGFDLGGPQTLIWENGTFIGDI